ncbi:MAG: bifunctional 23S rRNA (guanine(2069)-N(7))-methyltransferase RlmK/23S rRNA (guanine(2445)-N(2))-methyltransferase RlmL [Cellvibrionaceae bacterium]
MSHQYFAACPKGLETLLLNELKALGAESVRETVAGVYFSGERIDLYRACLWSRLANKILLPLETIDAKNEQALYTSIHNIPWEEHLAVDGTFKVDFLGTDKVIRNSQFGAVRVKDAIVDRFQAREGARPSVDKQNPDIIINARLSKGKVHVSLDLSGQSLHRRGYRYKQGEAPLKENLACAILLRANWLTIAEKGGYLIDPMCGSATLLIEGFLMAADIAPGLLRKDYDWGFTRWLQFDEALWDSLLTEAKARKQAGLQACRERHFECRGYDRDWRVLRAAEENIERAGFEEWIRVACKPIEEFTKPTHKVMDSGLLISNPPYGERLGEEKTLEPVYQRLGYCLREEFVGWQAAVITSNAKLAQYIGLRAQKKYKFWNGTIAAELLVFQVEPDFFYKALKPLSTELSPWGKPQLTFHNLSEGAQMVSNRLRKNQKQLRKWLNKESIECYRLYDADLPEYAAAVDVYGDAVHVQEYAAPKSIDESKAKKRFNELLDAVTVTLELDGDDLFVKQRRQNKGKQQYEKQFESSNDTDARSPLVVKEGQAQFYVDLWSYLDTGLFLDHRPVRQLIGAMASGKQFLNLFCYTATATVHAALGGAEGSVSVDMSRTYLDWAKNNFTKNNINPRRHELVQQDCIAWLNNCRQGFDLILLDPPSFSNSKRMDDILDIQRDHGNLIRRCMDVLNPGGTVIFSNNLRSFKLDDELTEQFAFDDITQKTFDPDFQRNRKMHHCWLIQHNNA